MMGNERQRLRRGGQAKGGRGERRRRGEMASGWEGGKTMERPGGPAGAVLRAPPRLQWSYAAGPFPP